MKINNGLGTGVESNVQATSLDFGIGDPAMVIEILRKRLYSNPIQTLVQEYISNARDACREGGLPERITVTIPSAANKVFKVRDYGVGISPDRIANVFVNYCSSTKRADNKQIGGFGIGAKSAWAYTDNFTAISYYNGVARHYSAHLGKKNSGSMDLISETLTNEPNGCEIQIAVGEYDINAFEAAIYRATYFWENRPELRGRAISEIPTWYRAPQATSKVGDKVSLHTREQLGNYFGSDTTILVIDGIPYALSYRFNDAEEPLQFNRDRYQCAIRIATGEVEVSASRESLSDGTENQQRVKDICNQTQAEISAYIKKDLKAAATLPEFLRRFGSYHECGLIDDDHTYNTKYGVDRGCKLFTMPAQFYGVGGVDSVSLTLEEVKKKTNSKDEPTKYRLEAADKAWSNLHRYQLLYIDKPVGKAVVYAKVRRLLMSLPEGVRRQAIVFSLSESGGDSAAFTSFVSDAEATPVSSLELDRKAPSGPPKPKSEVVVTTFCDPSRYGRSGRGHEGVAIDLTTNTKQFVYVVKETEPERFTEQKRGYKDLANVLDQKFSLTLCFVSETVLKKIEGDSNFQPVDKFWENALSYLTADHKKSIENEVCQSAVELDYYLSSLLNNRAFVLRRDKIEDPKLLEAVALIRSLKGENGYSSYNYRTNRSGEEAWGRITTLYCEANPDVSKRAKEYEAASKVFKSYPLMKSVENEAMDDLILYLNAKYHVMRDAATKKGGK